MDTYNDFLSGKDIPTIRRLDYIVDDTDPIESGYLYAKFRNLTYLETYTDKDQSVSDRIKELDYIRGKRVTIPKLEWVNKWMTDHGKPVIFTDVNDYRAVGNDYEYYWCLRTKEQFEREEEEARQGISGRLPVTKNP